MQRSGAIISRKVVVGLTAFAVGWHALLECCAHHTHSGCHWTPWSQLAEAQFVPIHDHGIEHPHHHDGNSSNRPSALNSTSKDREHQDGGHDPCSERPCAFPMPQPKALAALEWSQGYSVPLWPQSPFMASADDMVQDRFFRPNWNHHLGGADSLRPHLALGVLQI